MWKSESDSISTNQSMALANTQVDTWKRTKERIQILQKGNFSKKIIFCDYCQKKWKWFFIYKSGHCHSKHSSGHSKAHERKNTNSTKEKGTFSWPNRWCLRPFVKEVKVILCSQNQGKALANTQIETRKRRKERRRNTNSEKRANSPKTVIFWEQVKVRRNYREKCCTVFLGICPSPPSP